MTALTYENFVDVGKPERSFTCHACGGFQYLKKPFFGAGGHMVAVCEECYKNAKPVLLSSDRPKPGLREVLMSIWKAEYSSTSYWNWIKSKGADEEDVAQQLQEHHLGLWRGHYRKVTGENWT